MNKVIVLLFGCLWTPSFFIALLHYPGKSWVYALFSLVFLTLLVSGFKNMRSYGYLYLVVFLWLVFWMKMTLHIIFSYPFVEAVGSFIGYPNQWDDMLLIAILAALSILLVYLFIVFVNFKLYSKNKMTALVPCWFKKYRNLVWALLLIGIPLIAILNVYWGVMQIGLGPKTILLWPGNAVITWLLDMGFAMAVATVVWWEVSLSKRVSFGLGLIMFEAVLSSISIMSRGLYLFHVLPQLTALYSLGVLKLTWRRIVILGSVFIFLLLLSVGITTALRGEVYVNSPDFLAKQSVEQRSMETMGVELSQLYQKFGKSSADLNRIKVLEKAILEKDIYQASDIEAYPNSFFRTLAGLISDRWLGLEGLMAVYSYSKKDFNLFLKAMFEERKIGEVDSYQYICKSIYRYSDINKFQFGTSPGIVGFLYLSNSLFVVCAGMMVAVIILISFEMFVIGLLKNPIVSSLLSFSLAHIIAQFGLAPRSILPYFTMIIIAVIFLWLIQKGYNEKVKKVNA